MTDEPPTKAWLTEALAGGEITQAQHDAYEPPAVMVERRQWPNDPWPRSTLVTYEPPAVERRTPVDPGVCGYAWVPQVEADDLRRGICHRCVLIPGDHWPHRCRCGAAHDEHWE